MPGCSEPVWLLPPLLDASLPANTTSQVIQLRSPHMPAPEHFHLLDPGRVEQEGALDAYAVSGDPPDRERSGHSLALEGDDRALERLAPDIAAFYDSDSDPDRIAGPHIGQVLP